MTAESPSALAGRIFFADLHIHSRFSRATAASLAPETLAAYAAAKGLDLLGTGDLTHPAWLDELEAKLEEAEGGFYRLKKPVLDSALSRPAGLKGPSAAVLDPGGPPGGVRGIRGLNGADRAGSSLFTPTGEISCIYKQGGRTRKIHLVVWCPTLEGARKVSLRLGSLGNVRSDGRPILGLSARDATAAVLDSDPLARVIPAHVWTPWFSLFGSMSGFDDPEECFGDLAGEITALETGLSSDPYMNRLVSRLDRYALVSSSDAHGPDKLGREATVVAGPPDALSLRSAVAGGPELLGTVEFFPEEGKYHLDGHSACGPAMTPEETKRHQGVCPACGKPLTVGVLNRVMELADRAAPPEGSLKPDWHILPLRELIGQCLGRGPDTLGVREAEARLLNAFGSEYRVLLESSLPDLETAAGGLFRLAVERMRDGKVTASGGYDGVFGKVVAVSEEDRRELWGMGALFRPGGGRVGRPRANPVPKLPKGGCPDSGQGLPGGACGPAGTGGSGGSNASRGRCGANDPGLPGGSAAAKFPEVPEGQDGPAGPAGEAGAEAPPGAAGAEMPAGAAGAEAPGGPKGTTGDAGAGRGGGPCPQAFAPDHAMRPLFATDSGPAPPKRPVGTAGRRPRPEHPSHPPLPRPSAAAFGAFQPTGANRRPPEGFGGRDEGTAARAAA
ncbi:MAG: endonuclease Q family protein, partial [Deltaproteobacteria bacterium]|nr:endonuclease Q family protein [Deltaproteobacteria bacterium]